MIEYFFVYGSCPDLSRAEIYQLFKYFHLKPQKLQKLNFQSDSITFENPVDLVNLLSITGGTVKAGEILEETSQIDERSISDVVIQKIDKSDFGISIYADKELNPGKLAIGIKKRLLKNNRFVLPKKDSHEISAVVLKKQKIVEIVLIYNTDEKKWMICVTSAFQDVDKWTLVDRGRPFADSRSGMLPVKIARMLTNIALPDIPSEDKIFLDPFCGMGTILSQGLLTDWQVVGSDISQETVDKAQKNLQWLCTQQQIDFSKKWRLYLSDATHVSDNRSINDLNAVVTEPFMGAPFDNKNGQLIYHGKPVTENNIRNNIKGLEKLYIGCLKDWNKILSAKAKVVIIFPEINWRGNIFSVKKPIDNCEMFGYTLAQGPFTYARPQAIIKRKIHVFQKK